MFFVMLYGFNNANRIFVTCDTYGDSVGSEDVLRVQRSALEIVRVCNGYNLLTKNCYQFCRCCMTVENGSAGNCSFSSLEQLQKRELGAAR